MAVQELKLKITVDKDGAVSGIQQVKAAEEDLKTQNKSVIGSFTELNSAIDLAQKGFGILKSAVQSAVQVINQGKTIDDVTIAFERLSAQAGAVSNVFLQELNRVTSDTIDNLTLMRLANEALQKGLTTEEFSTAAAAARDLSDAFGTDLITELQSISRALETGNVQTLQNKLGIIDLEAAEKNLAATLGIKREELTKEQQVLAARTAILAAARDEAERGLRSEADAADLIAQTTKNYKDQVNQIKVVVATYPEIISALTEFRDLMKQINWKKLGEEIAVFVSNVIKSFNVLASSVINAKDNFNMLLAWFDTKLPKALDIVSDRTKLLRDQFVALTVQAPKTAQGVKLLEDKFKQITAEIRRVDAAFEEADDKTPFIGYQQSIEQVYDELIELGEQLNRFRAEASAPIVTELEVRGAGVSGRPGGGGGVTTGGGGNPGFFQDMFGFTDAEWTAKMQQLGADLENALAQAIGDGLRAAFDGGNSEDWKQISKNFGRDVGSALGMSVAGPIGQAIGGYLGEKGGKLIFDTFNHIFGGGRSDETKARKAVESWFDTILKDLELKILKDGKLEDITDFSRMKGGFQQGWKEQYEMLTGDLNDFYDNLGKVFLQVTGQFKEIGDQIGFLIADNFGYSLNNLQLFFYKAGISIDEFRDTMIKAFLDGDISATEFNNTLFDMQQVFEDGIPGALGDTRQAFDNLVASGGRGIASLDALRDIVFEGIEAGAANFDDLRENLLASGVAADQVAILFAEFEELGIWGFEALTEGSDELLINLIANLENAGFQFGTLEENIDSLGARLDDLERGRDIDIQLNVTTNADARAARLIDAGALPGVA